MKKMSPKSPLVGTRLRERRLGRGLRQAELARQVGISPSYLNLIEHNRRRIGGKLLNDLARALGTDPAQLAEGAEQAMLGVMQAAAERAASAEPELDRIEEFTGRFPGWAGVVAAQHRRIRELEHLVEALSDRLTHDPHLAANLHEVLTTVTGIRSAVSILTDEGGVDPEWQARFLRNMAEDTERLTDSASGLVRFLEADPTIDRGHVAPQEELSAFLTRHGHAFPALEPESAGTEGVPAAAIDALIEDGAELQSRAARDLARYWLDRYAADARAMPAAAFAAAWDRAGGDPMRTGAALGADPTAVLRRAACRPGAGRAGGQEAGLAICDGSGALIFRKEIPGFALPRFGTACSRWPLYQALGQPGRLVSAPVTLPGEHAPRFTCLAIARVDYPDGATAPPVVEAAMLIQPGSDMPGPATGMVGIGPGCRVCPRTDCGARREPSILGGDPVPASRVPAPAI